MSDWRKFWAAIWWFPLVPIALYAALFVAICLLILWVLSHTTAFLSPVAGTTPSMPVVVAMAVSAVLSMWIIFRYCERRSMRQSGFDTDKLLLDLSVGFLIGVLLVAALVGLLALFGIYKFAGFNGKFDPLSDLIMFFFAGINEEVIFRAFAFQIAETRIGTRNAFVLSCVLFGLAHMLNPVQGLATPEKIVDCCYLMLEAGVLLNAAFLVRRTLWLPVGIHWAWNYCEGPMFGMTVSGSELGNNSLMHAKLVGATVSTGGCFGPEASLAGVIVGTITGIIMLSYVLSRQHPQTTS